MTRMPMPALEQDNEAVQPWQERLGRTWVMNPYSRRRLDLSKLRYADGVPGARPRYSFVDPTANEETGYRDVLNFFDEESGAWFEIFLAQPHLGISSVTRIRGMDEMESEKLDFRIRALVPVADAVASHLG